MRRELATTYDPKGIEDRIYRRWEDKKYFHAEVDHSKKPFTIVIPPPNITGQLHMGHALDNTMQDILIRFRTTRPSRRKSASSTRSARKASPRLTSAARASSRDAGPGETSTAAAS